MSFHISAQPGEIAEAVLLPGDPLRAKDIAEKNLTDVVQINSIRNMLGFTGNFNGQRVTVMGTGMGIPSMSIYATELIKDYGVKKLIRIGTCGGLKDNVHVYDVVIGQAATTDSAVLRNTFSPSINYCPIADYGLLESAVAAAREMGILCHVGNVLSEDRFYNDEIDRLKLADYGILAVEMESAGLYLVAAKYHVQALAIFTVSNHLLTGEETTSEEREKNFTDMVKIALRVATKD